MQSKNTRLQVYADIKEFIYVAELMIDINQKSHINALSYLQIWCKRRPESKISRSIFITYSLLHAFHNEKTPMALSFALSKFISSECKEEEDKNNFNHKLPLYSTAKNIKLPAYMIQLRHNIIHSNQLVPFDQLIEAYHDAIEWLRNEFWIPQLDQIKLAYFTPEQMSHVLDQYINLMTDKQNISKDDDVFRIINEIFNGINFNEFFYVLLNDKFMFNVSDTNTITDIYLKNKFQTWTPLIEYLDDIKQCDTLIEVIFDSLTSCDQLSNRSQLIRAWCLKLLMSCSPKKKLPNKTNVAFRFENIKNVNWPAILVKFLKSKLYPENFGILKQLVSVHLPTITRSKQDNVIQIFKEYSEDKLNLDDDVELNPLVIEELYRTSLCFAPFGM